MSEANGDRSQALVNTVRQLPARTDLVNRGVALARHLMSEPAVSKEETVEAALSQARHAWITARTLAGQQLTERPLRDNFRKACLSAYHWGLVAVMADWGVPFSFPQPPVGGDVFDHAVTADWLVDEGQIGVDVGPHLESLKDDKFDSQDVCVNIETFLDEVTAFYEFGSPYMRLLATFKPHGDELRAALKLPNFIVNIDQIVQLAEEDAGNSQEGGTPRARITLEEAYRRVVAKRD